MESASVIRENSSIILPVMIQSQQSGSEKENGKKGVN